MSELSLFQLILIGLIFIWSGFVRSGLGFGGAVLSLPFLLMVDNRPLVYLPIIAVHLLVFASLTVWQNNRQLRKKTKPAPLTGSGTHDSGQAGSEDSSHNGTIAWGYLKYALMVMIIPKLVGVFGLIVLPNTLMSAIIFTIVGLYSLTYIFNKPFKSNSRWLDIVFLVLGAYISGTSLIGAPLVIAVFANHIAKHQLRDTLFALWLILVGIKLAAFIYAGIDLQLIQHLWLLPCAAIGHVLGLRAHQRMLAAETPVFFRVLGTTLFIISCVGLYQGISQGLG
ncbi:TSUP family transporter [Aestuariicella hydrocarbonica]|uniref:TSUP family transporter n=1 Tax=Pseudomaricurvus hydrocarbonicus TaxID=1470433 RepID=A0A9E5MMN0_9GAMM|nr:TSUP family transporter [Aestuariicella hydrocarbonica]NHO67046.1 TSUP family transporter [Aestuariicella hydrocarbonica]